MLHPSTQQLVRKLCELTENGLIAWKEGERQCSLFESEGYVVEVEAEPPTLRLLRGDGRELERADAAELAATAWPDGQGTYATHVTDMAKRAHRVARGAEVAISRILSALSAPPKIAAAPSNNESAAAMAAVNADLASQRRLVESLPPAPVAPVALPASIPASPPIVQSAPQPSPEPPKPIAQPPVAIARPAAPPSPPARKADFGSVKSFVTATTRTPALAPSQTATTPQPSVRPSPPSMLLSGISARSIQTPQSSTASDVARATPQPAAPIPTPKLPERATASGPSVYKPWN